MHGLEYLNITEGFFPPNSYLCKQALIAFLITDINKVFLIIRTVKYSRNHLFHLEFYLREILKEFKMINIFIEEIKFTSDVYKGELVRTRKLVSRNVTNLLIVL